MNRREENKLRKIASLRKREKFLSNFKNNIEDYLQDDLLVDALSAQGKWSRYVRDDFISMSINSYKTLADKHFYDGFSGLDQKRINALEQLEEHLRKNTPINRKARSDTKKGLQVNLKTQEKKLSILREVNLVLSKGLEVTVDALDKLAESTPDKKIKDIIESEMSKVKALLRRGFKLAHLDETQEK